MMTADRHILTAKPRGRREVKEVLQGIFVSELVRPSAVLWIVSPWISDIMVIDDKAGRFRFLHDSGQSHVRLSHVIQRLARNGTKIRIVTRPDPSNEGFLTAMRSISTHYKDSDIEVITLEGIHAKGLAGDGYALTGSMNLTWSGTQKWDELVHLYTGGAAAEVRTKFDDAYA